MVSNTNKTILVVDDEERMLRFIRLNLEHDGFQVIEAADWYARFDFVGRDASRS